VREICLAAGLGVAEINLVKSCIENYDECFIDSTAYEKLFTYFGNEGDMPLDVAKAIVIEPDIWILERLAACKSDSTVV
jgi:hypothetical protein